jgi:acyl-CoA reductase-like NAD-dependent aldehyde dehydrogenase
VIAGGKSDRDAHYLDPTLLYPITWDDKIMEDEIFGPILPILTYKSFDEAMARMAKPGVRSPASSSAATRRPSTGSSASCPSAGAA